MKSNHIILIIIQQICFIQSILATINYYDYYRVSTQIENSFELPFSVFVAYDGTGLYTVDAAEMIASKFYFSDNKLETLLGISNDGGDTPINGATAKSNKTQMNFPRSVVSDTIGNLYIADSGNNQIKKFNAGTKTVTNFVGTGIYEYNGDNQLAQSASIAYPTDVTISSDGLTLYIADNQNHRIRSVNLINGMIKTVAGNSASPSFGSYNGDGISATAAQLNRPFGVATDTAGSIYIADTFNSRIRKVTGGVISTIAGTGSYAYNGDGIAATSASLNLPYSIWVDSVSNIYFADKTTNLIRKISTVNSILSTIAGIPFQQSYSGDGLFGTSATLQSPVKVVGDTLGEIYVAETGSKVIRKLSVVRFYNIPPFNGVTPDLATTSYSSTSFQVCDEIVSAILPCQPANATGDDYVRLLDSNSNNLFFDDNTSPCGLSSSMATIIDTTSQGCQDFSLHVGCGNNAPCSIHARSLVLEMVQPLYPPIHCPAFYATNTEYATINTVNCNFTACPNDVVSIPLSTNCVGDQKVRILLDAVEVAENDDVSTAGSPQNGPPSPTFGYTGSNIDGSNDNFCSGLVYTVPSTASCATYVFEQGCFREETCSGQFNIYVTKSDILPTYNGFNITFPDGLGTF